MNQFRDYTPPDPFSFGNTAKLQSQIKQEKEEFKREEMREEMKDESRG